MSAWTAKPATGTVPEHSIFNKPLVKSAQDDREYRIIKLSNGLHATLIQDAKADKAAASLDVGVGHLQDPDDMPGLAHFCEHLSFMGTEQYPKENDYSEFLAKNNGNSNAYTSTTNTNYYFKVATQALAPTLTRFAAFFHSPLFAPSCVSRELNAVDSEHKKNHQQDMWRMFQLSKELSKDGHVWKKFGSGNRESLTQAGRDLKAKGKLSESAAASAPPSPEPSSTPDAATASDVEADGGAVGRETRRRLLGWWTKEYCADRMRLCILGKESLDELADLAATLFSPVKNRGSQGLPVISENPYGPKENSTFVSAKSIMALHQLELSFPIDWQPPSWQHKPGNFLSHFLGHEGPGSLYSYLKNKGWVTSLGCGPQDLARGIAMFKVTARLTSEGFLNHREVALATFKYIAMMRSAEFSTWSQKEIVTIAETRFRFLEKHTPDQYAVWVAEHMEWPVPRELILCASQLTHEWDQEGVAQGKMKAMLDTLTVDNVRITLTAKSEEHAKLGGKNEEWKQVPWYGVEYQVAKLDEEFVKLASQPNDIPELFLPGPNEFLPTNLDVEKKTVEVPGKRPHLIRDTPLSALWHKKDDQFFVPKAYAVLEITSPVANETARTSVLSRLYSDLVNDALDEFAYDASLAGLQYHFVSHPLGAYVAFNGYNDKLHVLARHILEKVKGIEIKADRLEVMKEQVKRDWNNFYLGQSYQLSEYYGRYLLAERQWTIDEKVAEISTVTAEEIQQYIEKFLAKTYTRMLMTGNVYKEDAIKLAEMAETILGSAPIVPPQTWQNGLILPEGSDHIWSSLVKNPDDANSSLTYYMHIGNLQDQQTRVTSALLSQIMSEPAFNVLRTKEQLGYIVSCGKWSLTGAGSGDAGLRILVQSEKTPEYLEKRVEAFIVGMQATIGEMEDKVFEEQKEGLQKKWTEAVKNMTEETGRFWSHIDSHHLDFSRREEDVEALKSITKQYVLDLFMLRIHPTSSARAKLSVHMVSQKPRVQKVSPEAAKAFEALVQAEGLTVDAAAVTEELGTDPPALSDFEKYWKGALEREVGERLLASVHLLLEQYPIEGESASSKDGATYITDVQAFKSSLEATDAPKPLMEWGDLPVAKF